MTIGEIIIIALLAVVIIILLLKKQKPVDTAPMVEAVRQELQQQILTMKQDLTANLQAMGQTNLDALEKMGNFLGKNQRDAEEAELRQLRSFEEKLVGMQRQLNETNAGQLSQMQQSLNLQLNQFREATRLQIEQVEKADTEQQNQMRQTLNDQMEQFRKNTSDQMATIEQRMARLEQTSGEKLEGMRIAIGESMKTMREENNRRLDEIRGTVDEKLQTTLEKRISESFKTVSEQLEQVYKGLGEMQTLAGDVGGLKKVLSGVKTRGILGEIQLGAILQEILAPEQYETDVVTVPGTGNPVEFAVKLPGHGGETVYLPIDSKFPGDRYTQLLEARESGNKEAVDAALKALVNVLKAEAKDIRDKYVSVPHTTGFGIMFLPVEGLYAEAVNNGLLEILQKDYQINIAGPSTMAALLNSLQMGFRTLAIQKRSNEVWNVLGAVKTEFDKFDDLLIKMKRNLDTTSNCLDQLSGTRTKAIRRKLKEVQELDAPVAAQLLELPEDAEIGGA